MFKKKYASLIVVLVLLVSLFLSSCQPAQIGRAHV